MVKRERKRGRIREGNVWVDRGKKKKKVHREAGNERATKMHGSNQHPCASLDTVFRFSIVMFALDAVPWHLDA